MAASKRIFFGLILAVGAAACAPVLDEPRQYYFNQEWAQLKEYWPGPRNHARMQAAWYGAPPVIGCDLFNPTGRTTYQDGVSDYAAYQECWDTPALTGPYAVGQRLKNRPEPLN